MKSTTVVFLLLYVFAVVEPWKLTYKCRRVVPKRCSKWLFWTIRCHKKTFAYRQCGTTICLPTNWYPWKTTVGCSTTCSGVGQETRVRTRHCYVKHKPYRQARETKTSTRSCSTHECPSG